MRRKPTDDPYEVMIRAIQARISANPADNDREMAGYRNACFDILEELSVIRATSRSGGSLSH